MEISGIKYDNEKELLKAELNILLPDGLKVNDLVCAVGSCEGIKEFNVL